MQGIAAGHLSQLTLDLLLLGDLDAVAAGAALDHVESCPACRERYESARGAYEHFEQHVHPRTVTRVTGQERAQTGTSTKWSPWWAPALALTGAATMALLLLRPFSRAAPSSSDDVILAKGSPIFTIYARRAGQVFAVDTGARLEPGDALRFTAEAGGYPFLLIASVDAANHATIYFPYQGDKSAPIGRDHFADDGSIVLDDTRGPERIFALFSNRAIEAVLAKRSLTAVGERGADAIRAATRLDVPADFQTSILIEK